MSLHLQRILIKSNRILLLTRYQNIDVMNSVLIDDV